MGKKDRYRKLSAKQLIKGCKLCCDNAERHYLSAIILGKAGEYGLANTHLILSSEEAIKAFVIFNRFIVDDDRDITDYFGDHKENIS